MVMVAMTRRWLLTLAAQLLLITIAGCAVRGCAASASTGEDFLVTCVIRQQETFDFKDVRFYELACGGTQGRAVLSIDADLPLAQALAQRVGQRVPITIGEGRETR